MHLGLRTKALRAFAVIDMNTLIAILLICAGCAVGTFLALALLAMAELGEDEE